MSDAALTQRLLRRNALVHLSARATGIVVWVLTTPFVLDRLGPVRFGIWSIFFAMMGYAAIADLGFGSAIPRFLPALLQRGDRAGVRRLIVQALAVSGVVALLWVLAGWWLRDAFLATFQVPLEHQIDVRASLPVLGLSIALFSLTGTFQAVLLAEQRLAAVSLIATLVLIIHVLLLVAGLNAGHGLRGAAWAALGANLVNLAISAWMVRRRLQGPREETGRSGLPWIEVLRFGGIVQVTNLAIVSWNQLAKVVLGLVGSLVQVTTFEIAYRLSNAAWSLATLIQAALLPAVSHAWSRGEVAEVRSHYLWACRWGVALGSLLIGGVFALAPAALIGWLGPAGAEAVTATRWLAAASLITLLMGPASISARACGWPGLEAAGFAGAVAVQVGVTVLTGRERGADGAAAGGLVGAALAAAFVVSRFHLRIGQSTAAWLWGIVLPRAGVAVLCSAPCAFWMSRWAPVDRAGSLRALAVIAPVYAAAYALATLPTGDLAALARRLGQWRTALRGAAGWTAG